MIIMGIGWWKLMKSAHRIGWWKVCDVIDEKFGIGWTFEFSTKTVYWLFSKFVSVVQDHIEVMQKGRQLKNVHFLLNQCSGITSKLRHSPNMFILVPLQTYQVNLMDYSTRSSISGIQSLSPAGFQFLLLMIL